jgi:chromosome segregation ATPase
LKDELNLVSQQSEVRRQKMVEKDKEIDRMRATIANVDADRDNFEASYKPVLQWWEDAQSKAVKAEERAEEYRIALMESDCRVDELEKQLAWAREEIARLTNERDVAVNENTALTFDVNDLRDALNVEKELRNRAEHERELYREKAGKYLDERNTAWDANKRLAGNEQTISYYQEIADKRQEKLDEAMRTITSLNNDIHELEETIDGLNDEKREYAEEIDRLRKVVTNLQSTRFTTDEFLRMTASEFMPSTGKGFADSVDF